MGAFGYIAPAMIQSTNEDIARKHALADEQRHQNTAIDLGILNNPNSADEDRAAAYTRMQSRYPTPAHAPQFLTDLLHIKNKAQGQQAQQPSPTAPSQPATPPATDQLGVPFTGLAPQDNTPTPDSGGSTPAVPQQVAQVAKAGSPEEALQRIKGYAGPQEVQQTFAKGQTEAAQKNARELESQRAESAENVAKIRAGGNIARQKLDKAVQDIDPQYQTFEDAPPEIGMQALRNLSNANRAQTWKAVTDGNTIYAVDAHDPSKKVLLGHKDDLVQHSTHKVMTAADGSQYLIPITEWTKKGSTQPILQTEGDAQPTAAPVSAGTPQGPAGAPTASPAAAATNPGARPPGTKPSGGAVKTKPQSAQTPTGPGLPKGAIPFGSKGSPLLKSDTAQYTKLAEDANGAGEALVSAQQAAASPTPTSDKELVYSWVRSNVQGAGRMTQYEFQNGLSTGSFGQRASNWWSLATTGKMTPEIRQMMLADIKRGTVNKQAAAAQLRNQVQQDMSPQSANTPGGPSASAAFSVPKDAPPAPKEDNKVLKANGQVIARSQGGQWVAP